MPQTIYEVLWIFIVYAVIGWCSEVAYAALGYRKICKPRIFKWTILSDLRIRNLIGHRSINAAERKFIDPVYRFRDTDLSH